MTANISRRRLIESSIVGTAALAGATSAFASKPVAKWDETVDIIVVGSGFAGLAAAIEAKNAGANVIVLEKMAVFGGNSAINGGILPWPDLAASSFGAAQCRSIYASSDEGGRPRRALPLGPSRVEGSSRASGCRSQRAASEGADHRAQSSGFLPRLYPVKRILGAHQCCIRPVFWRTQTRPGCRFDYSASLRLPR